MKYTCYVTGITNTYCSICSTDIPMYNHVHYLRSISPADYTIIIYVCNKCVPVRYGSTWYIYMTNSTLKEMVHIYNDIFSDSMDIVEYLKLALGRAP